MWLNVFYNAFVVSRRYWLRSRLHLSIFAFAHAGVGHGSYSPLVANAPVLIFIPEVGILAAVFGTPFLWAAYFLWIPEIKSGKARLFAVVLVALVHLEAGDWMASQDSYLLRTFKDEPWPHGLLLWVFNYSCSSARSAGSLWDKTRSRNQG